MKLLVTGTPGSGKTALVEYALKHGCNNFFDSDTVKDLCEWREYASGKVVGSVETITPVGGDSWYTANGWYWKPEKIEQLLSRVKNPVICGSADNIADFFSKFDRIILLYKSREDIVSNLMQPERDQPNGKDPENHHRILQWQETLFEAVKPFDPLIITSNVVSTIFEKVSRVLNTSS